MESDERGFTLNWAESRTLLEPDQFARNLEQTMLGEPGAAKDMAIGLAGFLDREPAEVWWAYWESQKTVQMVNLFGAKQNAQMLPPVGLFRRVHSLRVKARSTSLGLERSTIASGKAVDSGKIRSTDSSTSTSIRAEVKSDSGPPIDGL